MLLCSFDGTPVFWNPVPGGQGGVSRMCVDPGCHNPMFCHAELSEWTSPSELWFVELAYRTRVTDVRNPDVNSTAVIQDNIELSMWLNRLQFSVCEHSRVCVDVNTLLGDVMDSRNSTTIEQRRSDSGDRLDDDRVTPVPILTQTRFYKPVNELNLTIKVNVDRPP